MKMEMKMRRRGLQEDGESSLLIVHLATEYSISMASAIHG
jgi:hypothetical protein